MTGLFFCLASAEGAGLFCPPAIQPHTSVYNGLYSVRAVNTAHAIKQCTRLYRRFSGYLPYSTAANNRPTQAAITLPAPRWSVSQRRSTSSTYQIPPPRRTLCRSAQPPYYNKVYKGGQCSIPQTVPAAGSRYFPRPAACDLAPGQQSGRTGLHSPPGGAVKRQGAQRAARNHWRLPPQLFSGFRPIANRGQQ